MQSERSRFLREAQNDRRAYQDAFAELESTGINDHIKAAEDNILALTQFLEEIQCLEPRGERLCSLLKRWGSMMKEVKEKLNHAHEVARNISSSSRREGSEQHDSKEQVLMQLLDICQLSLVDVNIKSEVENILAQISKAWIVNGVKMSSELRQKFDEVQLTIDKLKATFDMQLYEGERLKDDTRRVYLVLEGQLRELC